MNPFQYLLSAMLIALSLCACNEPAPPPRAETPEPVLKAGRLQFPPTHPQLAQLGIVTAAPTKAVSVDLPARLVWNEEVTQRIYPAFAGRVTRIAVDVGQPVKRGMPLAQLASPDFGIAQADAAKAQVDSRLTQKALQRQRELFDAGITARKELDQAEAEAGRAQAESQRAEGRTRLYGATTGAVNHQLVLVAGVNGVVVERNLNPGQEVRPEQSGPGVPPLFVLTDPTVLWVQIDARESEAGTLKPGASFELIIPALPGQKFEGKVTAAADFIDPATRTIKVRGVVANPERKLKAEMLATARVERHPGPGVVVPAQAVALRGVRHSVFVQVQPGVFEQREVGLGVVGPREVVVSSGLEAGEQVVSENMLLLARQFKIAQDAAGEPPAAAATPALPPAAAGPAPAGSAAR